MSSWPLTFCGGICGSSDGLALTHGWGFQWDMDWTSVSLLQGLLQMSIPPCVSKCLRVDGSTGSYTRRRGARLWALSLVLGHLKAAPGIQHALLVLGSPETMGPPTTSLSQHLFLLFTFLVKTLRSCPLHNCP